MKKLFIILLLIFCAETVNAESSSLNLALPNSPQSYASDRVRAGQLECQNAIGGATTIEFGVVGILNQNGPYNNGYSSTVYVNPDGWNQDGLVKDVGVYAKLTIPLDKPKERINCNTLYKLELEKRRLEIQRLQQEVANLKMLRFADDGEE